MKAARFDDGEVAQRAYTSIHSVITQAQRRREVANLASYHLTDQENVHWYVAVVGQTPPPHLEAALSATLALGEGTPLPERLAALVTRYYRAPQRAARSFEAWLQDSPDEEQRC